MVYASCIVYTKVLYAIQKIFYSLIKEMYTFIQQGFNKWIRTDSKDISVTKDFCNKWCSFDLFIHQINPFSTKILSSTSQEQITFEYIFKKKTVILNCNDLS